MRILIRRPAFAATVVLVLGLGIGANTLVFLVADAALLRPLPYPNPSQLVWISQGVSANRAEYALAPDFATWRTEVQAFAQVAAFSEHFRNFARRGEPERIVAAEVSADFLTLLGVRPASGRDFLADDDRPGGDRVAILTEAFCTRRFGGRQNCLGETIKLDEKLFEVVGVLPADFRFPEPLDVDVFTPLALGPEQASRETSGDAGIRQIKVIARLRPSVTTAQAQAELAAVQQRIVQSYPQFQDGREVKLIPLHEHLSAGISHAALVLLGAVAFLWALGCLNVGSLLLARTVSRRGEMAIRLSLGASRLHLIRQVLAENAVLTLLGCALSFLITFWGHRLIVSIFPHKAFGLGGIELNARIIAFVVLTFGLTVLLVSLMAAWALPSQNLADFLKTGASNIIGSRKLRRALNVIVVGELAIAVVLLVAAGLMVKSFWGLRYRDLGFRPERLLTLRVDLPPTRYDVSSKQTAFFENLIGRVGTLPGVDAVALCSSAPPVPVGGMFRLTVEGRPGGGPGATMVRVQAVNSDYFGLLGIPLVDGQMFTGREQADGLPVVVVNRALVRQYLPDEYAVGKKIQLGGPRAPWQTIIGVVEDFKNVGLAAEPEPEAYRPYRQFPLLGSSYLLIKSSTADPLNLAPSVRREIWALDREQAIAEVQTLDERLTSTVAQPRFVMSLLVGFAALALTLAAAGVYGVMAYASQQRTREIAIRMALGAERNQVIWMMMREGILLSLLGAAIGIAGARVASSLLSGMLYGVTSSDPYTFLIVLGVLVFTTACGCYPTARRAARVEPLEVLRYE